MVMTEQGSVVEFRGPEDLAPARRSRRARVLVVLGVVTALVLGGGGVAYARWDADLDARLAAAKDELDQAGAQLAAAEDAAAAALESSKGKVADDQVRQTLTELVADEVLPDAAERGSRSDQITAVTTLASSTRAHAGAVEQATSAVTSAHAAWELARAQDGYDQALSDMVAAVDAAAAVLAGSEGKVADNQVRQDLADAIDAASAVREKAVASTVGALTAAAHAAAEATDAVTAASTATSQAQSAWQAEQDRIAAERAAAERAAAEQAAAAARKAAASSSGSSAGGGRSASPSGSSGGGGGTSSAPRVHSPSGSNFGTGTAPECTTPSCGITF